MSLTKTRGNMYDWVTHTHTHLRGECPHGCKYCYVQMMERGPYARGYYKGALRLDEKQLAVRYGKDKIIFVDNCNDLWANGVPWPWVDSVIEHCRRFPENDYVFQSKNPERMCGSLENFPFRSTLGTTVESDIYWKEMYNDDPELMPPSPLERLDALKFIGEQGFKTFVTIEPIMRMKDPADFARCIAESKPDFVNIGADSKGKGLPEPDANQVRRLIDELKGYGIEIRNKKNLERILK